MTEDPFEAWAEGVRYNDQPLTERGGIPYFLAAHAFEAGVAVGIQRARQAIEENPITLERQLDLATLDELEKHE